MERSRATHTEYCCTRVRIFEQSLTLGTQLLNCCEQAHTGSCCRTAGKYRIIHYEGPTTCEPCREWATLRRACFPDCHTHLRKFPWEHAGCHGMPRGLMGSPTAYRGISPWDPDQRGTTTSALRRSYMIMVMVMVKVTFSEGVFCHPRAPTVGSTPVMMKGKK